MDKEAFVDINNRQLYYSIQNSKYATGGRPFLVFLHEGLGCSAQWRQFPRELSEAVGCPVLLLDRFGYGLSEIKNKANEALYMHEEAYSFLPQLLEKLDIREKIIPIGHSDGGTIALLFAAKYPQSVMALIVEAAHVFCENVTQNGVKEVIEKYKQGPLKKHLAAYHADKTDTLFNNWSRFWISDNALKWDITNILPQIKSPILAIQGKDDNYGSVKQLTAILEKTHSTTITYHIKDCGHIPHYEKKTAVFSAMRQFILNQLND